MTEDKVLDGNTDDRAGATAGAAKPTCAVTDHESMLSYLEAAKGALDALGLEPQDICDQTDRVGHPLAWVPMVVETKGDEKVIEFSLYIDMRDGTVDCGIQAVVYGDESGYMSFTPTDATCDMIYAAGWMHGMLRYLGIRRRVYDGEDPQII